MDTEWMDFKRPKYVSVIEGETSKTTGNKGTPGVKWLSDHLKVMDGARQTGFCDDDLPAPFKVPKSFIHIPQGFLAQDGYPKSEFWLDDACRYSAPAVGNKQATRVLTTRAQARLRNQPSEVLFDQAGNEGLGKGKTRHQGFTRHLGRAARATAERQADQSPDCAKREGKGFNKEFMRFNDPELPVEDYERTKEIISNMYNIYTHGHGQFVDQDSKKLICTFSFEDLEAMNHETLKEHQQDISTIMMATDLFQRLPTVSKPKSQPKSSSAANKANSAPMKEAAKKESFPELEQSIIARHTRSNTKTGLNFQAPSHRNGLDSSPLTSLPPSDSEDNSDYNPLPTKKMRATTNGALIQGNMYCFGGRAGYERDILFSPYRPIQGASLSRYRLFLSQLPNFGSHIGGRFEMFADNAFLSAQQLLRALDAPPMSSISKEEPMAPSDFSGNCTFTFGNFHNKPHTDKDKGKVYCVWYPIDSLSRRIVTERDGFILEGGFFLFPEYRIAFNFGLKYATQISWSGKSTFHQTIQSKGEENIGKDGEEVHYTRLGCSSQITWSLARASVKKGTEDQFNFTSNCERRILDCDDILALPNRKWKP